MQRWELSQPSGTTTSAEYQFAAPKPGVAWRWAAPVGSADRACAARRCRDGSAVGLPSGQKPRRTVGGLGAFLQGSNGPDSLAVRPSGIDRYERDSAHRRPAGMADRADRHADATPAVGFGRAAARNSDLRWRLPRNLRPRSARSCPGDARTPRRFTAS